MNTKTLSFTRYVLCGALSSLMLLAPFFVQANRDERPERSQGVRSEIFAERHEFINERQKERLCRVFYAHTPLSIPAFCTADPEVPEPEPEAPTLTFSAADTAVLAGASTTLLWDSEHADVCTAEDGWSGAKPVSGSESVVINATTTFSLTCSGTGGDVSESVTVGIVSEEEPEEEPDPDPDPEPSLDHLIISEVHYDLANDGSEGSEVGGANEWVELYNPTNAAVDLSGWKIGDGTSNDVIASSPLLLGAHEFLLITNATTTANFWDLSDVMVVYLGSSISGGLANGGDSVRLIDGDDNVVDAMSYGSDGSGLDPSMPLVDDGSSAARIDLTVDTDTAADWFENTAPSPGA